MNGLTSGQVAAYLDRINVAAPDAPSPAALRMLQRAHLLAVPFENLDIAWGRPLSLEQGALFEKIVVQRRGGFCYELNGLFAALLDALGYKVTLLAAGVAREDGSYGPYFDHLTLAVRCSSVPDAASDWLTDVGFGDSFLEPLRMDTPEPQPDGERIYWLQPLDDSTQLLWMRAWDGSIARQYRFTRTPRDIADFGPMCLYHQTNPASHFTQQRLISQATPDGRVTLRDHSLIVTAGHARSVRAFDDAEFPALLLRYFGVRAAAESS